MSKCQYIISLKTFLFFKAKINGKRGTFINGKFFYIFPQKKPIESLPVNKIIAMLVNNPYMNTSTPQAKKENIKT